MVFRMGVELVRKYVSIVIPCYYRLAIRHSLFVFMVFILFWIYRSFPLLFSVLVHVFPVIASTLVLLGTLLYYGHANVTENQKQQGKPYHHHRHEHFNLINGIKFDNHHELGKFRDKDRRSDIVFITKDVKLKRDNRSRNVVDVLHNLKSQGQINGDDKEWDIGSDVVDSSSSSDSMANTFPMLDELHALIQSKAPTQTRMSNIGIKYVSNPSSVSGGMVNETYDYGYDDYDIDQEDVEVRDDENEDTLIMWTEDDQRNLMNLGTSELEKIQCFENLIDRQKALKNTKMMVEKNLVNSSSNLAYNATHISTAQMNPFGLSSSMLPKSNRFDSPNDPSDKHDHLGPIFHSNFVAVQPNALFGQPDLTCVNEDTCTFDLSEDKLHGMNEIGYQDKTRSSSGSSSFCDVADDMYDGQDDVEEDFKSISTEDSQDLQMEESFVDDSAPEETKRGRLRQRLNKVQHGLTSWLPGWKA